MSSPATRECGWNATVRCESSPRAVVRKRRNGTLRPVIAQELPLAQAARGHEAVMEPGHHGKIVLVP